MQKSHLRFWLVAYVISCDVIVYMCGPFYVLSSLKPCGSFLQSFSLGRSRCSTLMTSSFRGRTTLHEIWLISIGFFPMCNSRADLKMSQAGPFNRVQSVTPPLKGSFPLDHEGTCKLEMLKWVLSRLRFLNVFPNSLMSLHTYFHSCFAAIFVLLEGTFCKAWRT